MNENYTVGYHFIVALMRAINIGPKEDNCRYIWEVTPNELERLTEKI